MTLLLISPRHATCRSPAGCPDWPGAWWRWRPPRPGSATASARSVPSPTTPTTRLSWLRPGTWWHGTIPVLLRHVLGIDPRESWARAECGLPNRLDAVRVNAEAAPSVACCGLPPQRGWIRRHAPPSVPRPSRSAARTCGAWPSAGGRGAGRGAGGAAQGDRTGHGLDRGRESSRSHARPPRASSLRPGRREPGASTRTTTDCGTSRVGTPTIGRAHDRRSPPPKPTPGPHYGRTMAAPLACRFITLPESARPDGERRAGVDEQRRPVGRLRFLRHADVEGHLFVGELLVRFRMPVGDDLHTRLDQVKAREEPGDFVS